MMFEVPESRLYAHDDLVGHLDTLAVLCGCTGSFGGQLPDGVRPDVARFDLRRGLIFLGDAKHTETPGCSATRARLTTYFKWIESHVNRGGRPGIFAVCFSHGHHAGGWASTIGDLACEVGLALPPAQHVELADGVNVVWSAAWIGVATPEALRLDL